MTAPDPDRTAFRRTRRALDWKSVTDGARLEYTPIGDKPVIVRITGRTNEHLFAHPTGRRRADDELVIPRADVDAGRVAKPPARKRALGYAEVPGGVLAFCRCCDWEADRPQGTKTASEYLFMTSHARCPGTEAAR
ncbi:hypothetical protein [Streptodolium elevatio]|uniref:Uncharacterized protein n=1 Tax=Streptodolium elevatio TaxID=3157996 RepID=A0ABV3DTI6_9ACTN